MQKGEIYSNIYIPKNIIDPDGNFVILELKILDKKLHLKVFILNPDVDTENYRHLNNPTARQEVKNLLIIIIL